MQKVKYNWNIGNQRIEDTTCDVLLGKYSRQHFSRRSPFAENEHFGRLFYWKFTDFFRMATIGWRLGKYIAVIAQNTKGNGLTFFGILPYLAEEIKQFLTFLSMLHLKMKQGYVWNSNKLAKLYAMQLYSWPHWVVIFSSNIFSQCCRSSFNWNLQQYSNFMWTDLDNLLMNIRISSVQCADGDRYVLISQKSE